MPRVARIKAPDYIYHVICRSISELNLYRDDDDKNYYLGLLKKYIEKFHCRIYSYCLMNTHVHLQIDPCGFDISKFMHCLNVSYVIYYNKKYKRHGHLFQGRFDSKVVSSDQYNLALSAYIHNNPKDIEGYRNREEEYPFSSMGIYLGTRKDIFGLIDTKFLLGLFNQKSDNDALKRYVEFVKRHRDVGAAKHITDCLSRFICNIYRDDKRIIFRNIKPEKVMEYITQKLGAPSLGYIMLKSRRDAMSIRSFCAFVQRSLCGYSYKEICKNIGNLSLSGVARLSREGFNLYMKRQEYRMLYEDIVKLGQTAG